MHIDYPLIGGRIKKARRDAHMTQEELAERLDVSVGYVSQVERGVTKISLDLLGAIADILACDTAYFVTGASVGSDGYLISDICKTIEKLDGEQKALLLGIARLMAEKGKRF